LSKKYFCPIAGKKLRDKKRSSQTNNFVWLLKNLMADI